MRRAPLALDAPAAPLGDGWSASASSPGVAIGATGAASCWRSPPRSRAHSRSTAGTAEHAVERLLRTANRADVEAATALLGNLIHLLAAEMRPGSNTATSPSERRAERGRPWSAKQR